MSRSGAVTYHTYVYDHLGNIRKVVNQDGTVEEQTNYFPYGGVMNDISTSGGVQLKKYNGKRLDRIHGLDWYDYGARYYDAALAMFTTMDPLCEKYYHVSPYVYCLNNPIKFIDPDGREWKDINGSVLNGTKEVKVFIFYCSDFEEQAKVQYNSAIKEYGKNSVAMSLTSSAGEFFKDWGDMEGTEIANVMIMTHGKNQSIAMDDGSQFTSTGNGRTNLKSNDAKNIQDLPHPKGNISKAELNMYSCHSADKTDKAHGEGVHAQGALKGSRDPIAYAFAKKFGFRLVRGTIESVNYHSFFTDGTPVWSDRYYKPYPANGARWTIIKRK